MIDRSHELPIKRQAELVGISRGQVYYLARATSEADQGLMKRIDALHLEHPFAGSRMLRDLLGREGLEVGRRHVTTLMRLMGIEALYRKPNTSKKHPGHKVYPYLLRGMKIERANHVWATDITYIPMSCGWVYLCAIVDWASRKVLSHRVSISMDSTFCVEALEEALAKYGQPEIFNTDQGSQFTSEAFSEVTRGVKSTSTRNDEEPRTAACAAIPSSRHPRPSVEGSQRGRSRFSGSPVLRQGRRSSAERKADFER